MLLKTICGACGAHFLADPQLGARAECPSCAAICEVSPDAQPVSGDDLYDEQDPLLGEYGEGAVVHRTGGRFDPSAPPPIYVRGERLVRGMVFGVLGALLVGGILGGTAVAVSLDVPLLWGLVLGPVIAFLVRSGFGGRSVGSTRRRAVFVTTLCAVLGIAAFLVGGWAAERQLKNRSATTRQDLAEGLQDLEGRSALANEQERLDLEPLVAETRRLQGLSDAALEDYLWVQEAQLNQPVLAYAALRVKKKAIVRFGPDMDPVEVTEYAAAGALFLSLVLAVWLAARGVVPRGRARFA